MNKVNFIWCIEAGNIEQQSRLLVKSFNTWQRNSELSLNAYSPRAEHQPNEATINSLKNHNVNHFTEPLNQNFLAYPIANKLLACADFEASNPGQECLVFLDTDTVFIKPLDAFFTQEKPALFLRPVDNKGPGSESFEDDNDEFWQALFKLFDLPLPEATLNTTVRLATIRPYYNAGFIGVNKIPGFYQQWLTDFLHLIKSGLRPFTYQSRDGDDFRCLDQMALAVTASRYSEHINILPETYNYPIPFRPYMQNRISHPTLSDIVHIHYHKWFQHPGFLDHVTSEEDKKSPQYAWLKKHLPLHPTIDGPFKC